MRTLRIGAADVPLPAVAVIERIVVPAGVPLVAVVMDIGFGLAESVTVGCDANPITIESEETEVLPLTSRAVAVIV